MIINPYIFSEQVYLVDDYSFNVAFSFRKLSSTATNCIRIRRISDDAEQDIGFNGNVIDVATLESFCSGTDGQIVSFYNQGTSGSTYDVTQSTKAQQVNLVTSGTTNTASNGKYVTSSSTTTKGYDFATNLPTSAGTLSSFGAADRSSAGIEQSFVGGSLSSKAVNGWFSTNAQIAINTPSLTTDTSTGLYLASVFRDGSNSTSKFINGSEITGSPSTITATDSYPQFLKRATAGFEGGFFEYLHKFTDLSADQGTIEANINDYYSLY